MRLINADNLDETITRLNEQEWGITRNEYKLIDRVLFEMPTVDVLDKIRDEIEQITDTMGVSYNQYVSKIDVLQIIDKYMK